MTCAKAFLDLQLQFAERVTAPSGLPLARALLEYTNRDFDPAHAELGGPPRACEADPAPAAPGGRGVLAVSALVESFHAFYGV